MASSKGKATPSRPRPNPRAATTGEKRTSFVSSEAIDGLDYDFTAHGGGSGSIPEPSSWQVDAFRQFLGKQFEAAQASSGNSGDEERELTTRERVKLLSDVLSKDDSEGRAEILDACSAMCSGTPSVEELAALPYRLQQKFFGWLTGVFLNPEA